MVGLEFSDEDVIPGILIESVTHIDFNHYFYLAINSRAMQAIEEDFEDHGVMVDSSATCSSDVYSVADFSREISGVRVDFTVQTKHEPASKLAKWWNGKVESPVLDFRMYFPDGKGEPVGSVYLRAGDTVLMEYEFIGTRLTQNVFAPGGILGYKDRSEIDDFFNLLPKG